MFYDKTLNLPGPNDPRLIILLIIHGYKLEEDVLKHLSILEMMGGMKQEAKEHYDRIVKIKLPELEEREKALKAQAEKVLQNWVKEGPILIKR